MTEAVFPHARRRKGMYESFYLRAVSPDEPLGIWIRHTVHKRPGERARGSVWCTLFDASRERPFAHKETTDALTVPAGAWIDIGGSRFGPASAEGSCGAASWSLRVSAAEPELRHLPRPWLYGAPVPRTKLTSPAPAATFDGTLEVQGRVIDVRGWRGMIGHNWGAEHAERWVWLHGVDFAEDPAAWIDVAVGRVLIAGRMTPWVANGAISAGGQRTPLGGLLARGVHVDATVGHGALTLPGPDGMTVDVTVDAPLSSTVGWRYADPTGGEHDVANCSIAGLKLTVHRPGEASRTLSSPHGGTYELGMREHDHGVPIEPFGDG